MKLGLTSTLLLAMLQTMAAYPGGKERAAARIINLIPPHKVYIEPFAGGAAVWRAKRPAERSILIDLDPAVVERLGARMGSFHAKNGVPASGTSIATNSAVSGDTRAVCRPRTYRALDLFCGAGGVTKGLQRAGFHVTGIDLQPQPRYCGDAFIQGDAVEADLSGYDFVWASPPCQAFSCASAFARMHGKVYPDLIEATRAKLVESGLPYVIENVQQAPLKDPLVLDGTMFPGLKVIRKRCFESNVTLTGRASKYTPGLVAYGGWSTVVGGGRCSGTPRDANAWHTNAAKKKAMGIDWMNRRELAQAIPPPYSEFIGRQVLAAIEEKRTVGIGPARNGGGKRQGPGSCKPTTPKLALVDDLRRRVEVWNADGIEFLKSYRFDGTEVVYLDPPYPMETRSSGRLYHCEMTDKQHRELLKVAVSLPCKVLISGYDCPMYREALKGWESQSYSTMTRGGEWTEFLWWNYPAPEVLHDWRYFGDGFRAREKYTRRAVRFVAKLERMTAIERNVMLAAIADYAQTGVLAGKSAGNGGGGRPRLNQRAAPAQIAGNGEGGLHALRS